MRFFSYCLFLVIISYFTGCSKEKYGISTIQIHAKSVTNQKTKLIKWNMLDVGKVIIASTQIDSSGVGNLEFSIDKPLLASLEIGNRMLPVYLEPDYNLTILEGQGEGSQILYTGKGSKANNYLAKFKQIEPAIENAGGKNLFDLDQEQFLKRMDTIKESLQSFHVEYVEDVGLADHVETLFQNRITIINLVKIQTFGFNYGTRNSFDIPEPIIVTNIPFDSLLLESQMIEYAML